MASKPRVFATRRLPGEGFERLAREVDLDVWDGPAAPRASEIAGRARSAAAVLCLLSDLISSEFLRNCPNLRVVSSCSVGVDHVDLAAATELGIRVGNTPGVLAETTADLAFALLLAAARRIPEADRFVRAGRWQAVSGWDPELLLGRDLHHRTLGVVGLGAIGRAVARRAQGFAMRTLGWTHSGRGAEGVEPVALDALLSRAHFVSIHVAATPETEGLIGREALARLQPGAVLVNTARGGIVDEDALADALRSGHLAAAALDVYRTEPLAKDSPLLDVPNLVLTPHIGSASAATRARMADLAVENLLAGLAGRKLPHCANPEVERPG